MKFKVLIIFLVLTASDIFSQPDLTEFLGYLPVNCEDRNIESVELELFDKPGFFENPGQIYKFPCSQTFRLTEVSENMYMTGGTALPFYKIQLPDGGQKWAAGCSLLIVSTKLDYTKAWYMLDKGYSNDFVQIYVDNGAFHYVYSKYDGNKYNPEGEPSKDITKYYFQDKWGEYTYRWDPEAGLINWIYRSIGRRDNEENSYYMTVNRSYLEIKRTLNLKDEEFWYYYGNNDFEGLNKLLAEGFDNYMGIYMTRAESPMIDAIEKRNFEMIKFLLDNGFSPRTTSGNYDGTVSCLLRPIKDNDLEMVEFLVKNGVGQNIGGEMGTDYDLYFAIRYRHPEMVKLMIDLGYDPNEYSVGYSNGEDSSGAGIFLNTAIYYNDLETAEVLLENGANPNLLSYSYAFRKFSSSSVLDKTDDRAMTELLKRYGAKNSRDFSIDDYRNGKIGLSSIVNDDRVRFRDAPSLNGNHIDFLEKDEQVIAVASTGENMKIGEMESPWYLVRRQNGDMGWVYGYFVNIDRGFRNF